MRQDEPSKPLNGSTFTRLGEPIVETASPAEFKRLVRSMKSSGSRLAVSLLFAPRMLCELTPTSRHRQPLNAVRRLIAHPVTVEHPNVIQYSLEFDNRPQIDLPANELRAISREARLRFNDYVEECEELGVEVEDREDVFFKDAFARVLVARYGWAVVSQ
jgi:hypothetical protein